jgi:hypothetical protein
MCAVVLHKDVERSLGMAVNQVGLLSDVYCTLLPAGVDGFTWNFFGNTGLEKEQLSNPMIVTDSSFVEDQKCVLVNHGLFVVQGGHCITYICGRCGHNNCMAHLQEQITVDLLDFNCATHVPSLKLYTS